MSRPLSWAAAALLYMLTLTLVIVAGLVYLFAPPGWAGIEFALLIIAAIGTVAFADRLET